MLSPRSLAIGIALVAFSAACRRGPETELVIRQRTNAGGSGGHVRDVTIYVRGRTRADDYDRIRKIVDLDAKTVTTVYKEKKTYTQRTFAQLHEQAAAVQKRLDALPAQARDLIANLVGKDHSLELKPTGKTDKIAGIDAAEYAIESGGVGRGSVWVAEALEVPREGRDWELVTMTLGGFQSPDQQLAQALAGVKGFPLRTELTTEIGKQRQTLTTETIEVKREPVPAAMLTVPEDCKQVVPPSMATPSA